MHRIAKPNFTRFSYFASVFVLGAVLFTASPAKLSAQIEEPSKYQAAPRDRSSAFESSLEYEIEHTVDGLRRNELEQFNASELERLQNVERDNYGEEQFLLSLNLFRSLASFLSDRTYQAQALNDQILQESAPGSRVFTNSSLLSALEFYSHSPLRRGDVESGLARLTSIVDVGAASAAVIPEIRFWRAEGYRALDELAPAEQEYVEALHQSSDPRLTALTQFRLAELLEHEERFVAADSLYNLTSRNHETPLMVLAMLRRASVLRSEKRFAEVQPELDQAQNLYDHSIHDVRTSAREFRYTSPIVEELLLQTTEKDRIFASAPQAALPHTIDPPQLVSPYFASEVALLRGSALSELGQYDSATDIITAGETAIGTIRDSASGSYLSDQARFVSNALKFEKGWSLFQRKRYEDAATSFLQLAAEDTARRHLLTRNAAIPLRSQGIYYDPFLADDNASAPSTATVEPTVLARNTVDTSFFFYNDFPERARFYAGVALARAGKRKEAADVFSRLAQDKSVLYSDRANYQLALIRFADKNYEAQGLLEPLSYERSVTGAYSSFLLGELAYRKSIYEKAEQYFLNSFENMPKADSAIRATAHLERGLSLVPLNNWPEVVNELNGYLHHTTEAIPGKTDEALFWLGKAYFRTKQYDSSRVVLEQMLSQYPTSTRRIDATYAYAWALFQQNDYANAEKKFEEVIAIDSISRYSYDALARAADSYYAMSDLTHADKLYNQAVDRPAFNPLRTTRALMQLGTTRMRIADSARSALTEFNYITTKYSTSDIVDEAYFDLALSAYAINQPDRAEEAVHKLVTTFHQSSIAPKGLFVAAEERVRRNDLRGSLPYYQQLVTEYPRSNQAGPALFALQDALVSLKRIPEALATADTFVARNPSSGLNASILLRSGDLRLRAGDPAHAVTTYEQFIKRYPADPSRGYAEYQLARAELATGDTVGALAQFGRVTTLYDTTAAAPLAYLERARFERQKNPAMAESDYRAAYQMRYFSSDAAPLAMTEYAQLLIDEKKTDSAIAVLNDLGTRYPVEASTPARALIREGMLLTDAARYNEARTVLGRVTSAHPKDVLGGSAMVRTADTYLAQEQWQPAIDAYIAAKRDFAVTAESEERRLMGLGIAYSKLGKKPEAVRELRALVEMKNISDTDLEKARAMLKELAPPKPHSTKKAKKGATAE